MWHCRLCNQTSACSSSHSHGSSGFSTNNKRWCQKNFDWRHDFVDIGFTAADWDLCPRQLDPQFTTRHSRLGIWTCYFASRDDDCCHRRRQRRRTRTSIWFVQHCPASRCGLLGWRSSSPCPLLAQMPWLQLLATHQRRSGRL